MPGIIYSMWREFFFSAINVRQEGHNLLYYDMDSTLDLSNTTNWVALRIVGIQEACNETKKTKMQLFVKSTQLIILINYRLSNLSHVRNRIGFFNWPRTFMVLVADFSLYSTERQV